LKMKIAILTNETPHHAYFVREVSAVVKNVMAFCESNPSVKPTFPTHHVFEDERYNYEWQSWFAGTPTRIDEITETQTFASINDQLAIKALAACAADVVLVFGTGVLKSPVISVRPDRIFNFHGGDPETYRGLDTHLWAIYHRDFSSLVTTLHRVDTGLDSGDIILQGALPLSPKMGLHTLRRVNTEICVQLALSAINMVACMGDVIARPQRAEGRYYSSMPTVLKDLCKKRFESYTARLDGNSQQRKYDVIRTALK